MESGSGLSFPWIKHHTVQLSINYHVLCCLQETCQVYGENISPYFQLTAKSSRTMFYHIIRIPYWSFITWIFQIKYFSILPISIALLDGFTNTYFFMGMQILCVSPQMQIHKFLGLFRNRKCLRCASSQIANPQISLPSPSPNRNLLIWMEKSSVSYPDPHWFASNIFVFTDVSIF